MRGSSLQYLTKEGFRNVWVNHLMSIASVAVLVACLVIIGLGSMLYFNINALLDTVESQNVIMVYVADGTSAEDTSAMKGQIELLRNIDSVTFVPKDEAFEEQKESMGADAALFEGLDENPLPDAYKVVVTDLNGFRATADELRKLPNVEMVRENTDFADQLISVRKAVTIVCVGIVSLLFLVSLFIISNTIRITMFSRKLEISIMKAVGATNWFIRWPFMIEGVLLGIVASILSIVLLWGLYEGMDYVFRDLLNLFQPVAFWNYAGWIFLVYIAIGVFVGSVGSLISMSKYLKEQGSVVRDD